MPSLDPTLLRPCRLYFSLNDSGDAWLVTGISVTDATGSSSPATATLISSRFLMNGSMSASTSYSNTLSTPATSSSGDAAVDTPALDPRLHGLTMTGQPKPVADLRRQTSRIHADPRSSTARSHDSHGTTGTPACAATIFVSALVHADRRREHAAADVGAAAQLEQALDAAVFAERAVQDRDEDVD